jgi:hypothetical protein
MEYLELFIGFTWQIWAFATFLRYSPFRYFNAAIRYR